MSNPIIRRPSAVTPSPVRMSAWALGGAIGNTLTFGARRRAERRLPLVPGEVVVGWLQDPDTSDAAAEELLRLVESPLAGGARARATRDLQRGDLFAPPRREIPAPPSTVDMRVFALSCRPGRERDLVRLLLRSARLLVRRGQARWIPGTFRASRVPWLDLHGDLTLATGFSATRTLKESLAALGVDLSADPGSNSVSIGVLDAGVHDDDLLAIRDRVTVKHLRKDGFATHTELTTPIPHGHGSMITGLIAAVAPHAHIDVIDVIDLLPTTLGRKLSATWLFEAVAAFEGHDLLNVSATINGEGEDLTADFERLVRDSIGTRARFLPLVVVAACGDIREIQADPDTLLRGPSPAGRLIAMGFPANDLNVIAVSSTDDRLIPVPERTRDKHGDLFWHMPGGTPGAPLVHDSSEEPINGFGSSLAAALFTGVLARLLGQHGTYLSGVKGRNHTLRVADDHTQPWSTVDLHGRSHPESRGLLHGHD